MGRGSEGQKLKIEDISKESDQLVRIEQKDLIPLPYPYDIPEKDPVYL